jgi:hypothetical protein
VDELVKKMKPRETLITFKEVYDIETATPLPVYEETLNTGREELGRFGL